MRWLFAAVARPAGSGSKSSRFHVSKSGTSTRNIRYARRGPPVLVLDAFPARMAVSSDPLDDREPGGRRVLGEAAAADDLETGSLQALDPPATREQRMEVLARQTARPGMGGPLAEAQHAVAPARSQDRVDAADQLLHLLI